jgi:pimeloyl-ACP methyl ester carboxylesterase
MTLARGRSARVPWALGALVLAAVSAAVLGGAAWQRADACRGFSALEARCSTVTVPENREAPSGRTISLRVVVLPARSERRDPDPVFFLAGGPGQGASSLAAGHAHSPLRATRDLVFADQRGTGGSNPLSCQFSRPEDWAGGRPADFLPVGRVRECRAALERTVDLTQYTTAAAVADLEAVRVQLGYERINISGGSYGTRLAMEYVRAHPERVRAVVLDGAVAPSVAMPAGFGASAQRTLDAVLDECAADLACAAAFPDIRTKARELFARLERAPLRVTPTDGGAAAELTRDHVAEAVRYLTYTTAGASRVPQLLARAHAGDGSGLLEVLRGQRLGNALGGLYLSVTCAEDVPFVDPASSGSRHLPVGSPDTLRRT